ncbi:MAG: NUDIX domain-containing protein [Rickettsiales bacterium]
MTKNIYFHFGVYGACFDESGTHVLAIVKRRGAYAGRYDLPGGTVDVPETLEDTLRREIKEETGCVVESAMQRETLATLFEYADENGRRATLYHVWLLYDATVTGVPSDAGDGLDSDGALWLSLAKINESNVSPALLHVARRFPST